MDKTKCFNLDQYEEMSEGVVRIKDPADGLPTDATVTIAGPNHPERKRIVHARQRKMRAAFQKTGKLQFADPAEEEEEDIQLLVACTFDWSNVGLGGQLVPFSREEAKRIYSDPKYRWFRDQVREGLDAREIFIKSFAAA
jgi:hypothetical protein